MKRIWWKNATGWVVTLWRAATHPLVQMQGLDGSGFTPAIYLFLVCTRISTVQPEFLVGPEIRFGNARGQKQKSKNQILQVQNTRLLSN